MVFHPSADQVRTVRVGPEAPARPATNGLSWGNDDMTETPGRDERAATFPAPGRSAARRVEEPPPWRRRMPPATSQPSLFRRGALRRRRGFGPPRATGYPSDYPGAGRASVRRRTLPPYFL